MGAFTDFLKVTKPPERVKKTLNQKAIGPPGSNGEAVAMTMKITPLSVGS